MEEKVKIKLPVTESNPTVAPTVTQSILSTALSVDKEKLKAEEPKIEEASLKVGQLVSTTSQKITAVGEEIHKFLFRL
ncbi:hypothetical protein BpHYR1_008327 [Brachionus plicatilis]|uniref:Uncharacterized protein n=1 Tax=Brachionus plicatilis TaxID=10195 RepID=A0A3M7RYW1_BRAPC|nr:hypothetical protein BpHYR1_008327 [Brachionus plicatilis]